MKPNLPRFLSAISLALLVAAIGAWLCSYLELSFVSAQGRLYIVHITRVRGNNNPLYVSTGKAFGRGTLQLSIVQELEGYVESQFQILSTGPAWSRAGVSLYTGSTQSKPKPLGIPDASGQMAYAYPVPYWAISVHFGWLVALAGILPLLALLQWNTARRRRKLHRCVECGYDLRATPGRCPECGAIPLQVRKLNAHAELDRKGSRRRSPWGSAPNPVGLRPSREHAELTS